MVEDLATGDDLSQDERKVDWAVARRGCRAVGNGGNGVRQRCWTVSGYAKRRVEMIVIYRGTGNWNTYPDM